MDDEPKKKQYGLITDAFREMSRRWYADLLQFGLTPQMAGSVVAHIMLQEAWAIAGAGKILSGAGMPDPEKFIEAALAQTESVSFDVPEGFEPQGSEAMEAC